MIENKKWIDLKMEEKVRELIKSTKLYGVCAFKTYWQVKEEDGRPADDVYTERVPLKNLLKSPDHSWCDSPWIAHEVCEKVNKIADKFNIRDASKIAVEKNTKGSGYANLTSDIESDFNYGVYYEIEDIETGELIYIVKGLDKFAKPATKKEYKFRSMYDFLSYNDIPDRPEVKSDYFFWRAQLEEVQRYRTMFMNHARKGVTKYAITAAEPLSEIQKTQLMSSNESGYVEFSPGQIVQELRSSGADPSIIQAYQLALSNIQLISKLSPIQEMGGDKTATEVKAVEFSKRVLTSESLKRLEEVLASVAQKHVELMQGNYEATRVLKLTEMPEAKFMQLKDSLGESIEGSKRFPFIKMNSSTLKGKVSAKIRAGSTTPDTEENRVNRINGFTKFISSSPTLASQIDTEELVKDAQDAYGLHNENLLKRKDNPGAENELLSAGVYIAPKMTEDHVKHLEVHKNMKNLSPEGQLHILGHEMFQQQIEKNNQAEIKSAQLKAMEQPITGSSFNGMGANNAIVPDQQQAMQNVSAMSNMGPLPPQ